MIANPTAALRALGMGGTPDERRCGWMSLLALRRQVAAAGQPLLGLTAVMEDAWREVSAERPALIRGLVRVVSTDHSLAIDFAAYALALEGGTGAAELLGLGIHQDFSIRSTVALAFCELGARGRWAVPALLCLLENEPVEYVAKCLIWALGSVGGSEAVRALECIAAHAEAAGDRGLTTVARDALREARPSPENGG